MLDFLHLYWRYYLIGQYPDGPLGGLALTLLLSVLGLLGAFPLGLLIGIGASSSFPLLKRVLVLWGGMIRSVPLLMMVFWVYFFIPSSSGFLGGQFGVMLLALIVFESAYLAEIVRSGIASVPQGQVDSARSLGFDYWRTLGIIVLPQAWRPMLPSLVNEWVATIKNTSLGYVISLPEVSLTASQIGNSDITKNTYVYCILGLTYFGLCGGLSLLAWCIEKKFKRF